MSSPSVAVVILNWNNFRDSRTCVESVLAEKYPYKQIIVVDNASRDNSLHQLKEAFPGLSFVENSANLGFSGGINTGLRYALQHTQCKYFLIVNNDCRLAPDSISPAVREFEADRQIGLVAAKILFDEKSRKVWHTGGWISRIYGRSHARGFGEIDRGQFDHAEDTEWASGALMMVSREVLEKVGLLCEEYFFGVEEWDYSITVRKAGYRIRYCPAFEAYHAGDGSHDNTDPRFVYSFYRNKQIFQQRHLPPGLFPLWRLLFRAYVAVSLRRSSIRLAQRHGLPHGDEWLDDVEFAAGSAIRDHGTNQMSERTMADFAETLRARKRETAIQGSR